MRGVLLVESSSAFDSLLEQKIKTLYQFNVFHAADHKSLQGIVDEHHDEIFVALVDVSTRLSDRKKILSSISDSNIPILLRHDYASSPFDLRDEYPTLADHVPSNRGSSFDYILKRIELLSNNHKFKVLCNDVKLNSQFAIANFLRLHSFDLETFACMKEAQEKIELLERTDILILDARTEDFDLDILCTIRRKHSLDEMTILVINDSAGRFDGEELLKNGATDVIDSKALPELLLSRLDSIVEKIALQAELKLERRGKLKLLGKIAHDVRGPIGSIVTVAEMLLREELDKDKREKMLKLVKNSGKQTLNLVSALYELSSLDSEDFELQIGACDFCSLVQDVVGSFEPLLQDNAIKLQLSKPDMLLCMVDQMKMRLALNYLLESAIGVSPNAGLLEISLSQSTEQLHCLIRDQGEAVKAEEEARLFEPFEKLSRKKATGEKSNSLGLAIAKKAIVAHGGAISYRRENDEKNQFSFHLPLNLNAKAPSST